MPFAGISRKCSAPTISRQNFAMPLQRKTLRHFQRRPEFVFGAGRNGIGRAQDDVAGERIALRHPIEGRVDFFRRHFPGNERAIREIGGEQVSGGRAGPCRRATSRRSARARSRPAARRARAISANGSRTKPAILSSEIARMRALIGSLCSTGMAVVRQSGRHAAAQEKTARKWQAVPRSTNKCQTKCV